MSPTPSWPAASAPSSGDGDDPVGIVTEHDLVGALGERRDPAATTAADVAHTTLVWCDADATVAEVAEPPMERYVRHVLIEDQGGSSGSCRAATCSGPTPRPTSVRRTRATDGCCPVVESPGPSALRRRGRRRAAAPGPGGRDEPWCGRRATPTIAWPHGRAAAEIGHRRGGVGGRRAPDGPAGRAPATSTVSSPCTPRSTPRTGTGRFFSGLVPRTRSSSASPRSGAAAGSASSPSTTRAG